MERQALVNKVKVKIDEIVSEDTPLVDVGISDQSPIDEIIDELLDESAVELLLKAPFHRLDISSAKPSTTVGSDPVVGHFDLPEDFLRLVYFRMSDWLRPVTELSIKGDAVSLRQANKHIRGGIVRPVGVLAKTDQGLRIEYYSTMAAKHTVEEFYYIKREKAENIPDQMVDVLLWICAGKVLTVFSRSEDAKNAFDNAQGLMI